MPSCVMIFCCLVGRGFRVENEFSSTGGGSGATGAHL